MKWKFINNGNAQEDEEGNILQRTGGVVPKACQKCKKKFNSVSVEKPLKQNVPQFECKECDFISGLGDEAFLHFQENSKHVIKRTVKERVVGVTVVLEGVISHITKKKKDVVIVCGDCI